VIPRTLAEVDLTAIVAALAAAGAEDLRTPMGDPSRHAQLEQELAAARARIAVLEEDNGELNSRLAEILALAAGGARAPVIDPVIPAFAPTKAPQSRTGKTDPPQRVVTYDTAAAPGTSIHPAARKLLTALAQHAPARFTWGQAATLAGLKPSGGHFNSGRKDLRAAGYVAETNGLVTPTPDGLKAAGDVPPAPSTPADRLAVWCSRLPAPAPEMLRTLAAHGERYMDADELAEWWPLELRYCGVAKQRADRNRRPMLSCGQSASRIVLNLGASVLVPPPTSRRHLCWARNPKYRLACLEGWVDFFCAARDALGFLKKMLELRPYCEWCDKALPPDAADARICTYECTFCAACVKVHLHDCLP
jgi:hypothetical protein